MKTQPSTYKKMLAALAVTVILAPAAILPVGFHSDFTTAYAAEATAPSAQTIVIHKLMYTGTTPSITNTGEALTLPAGVKPFDSAKYGDVQFTVVDITDYAKTRAIGDIQTTVNGLAQTQYNNFITTNKKVGTTATVKSVDANGEISFASLAAKEADGTGHTYAIFETKSAKGLVGQLAKPLVISLPMTNVAGDGFLSTINVYPKNEVKELSFELLKYSEEIGVGKQLAGAEFDVYKGTPGKGTKVNSTSLTTDSKGSIKVSGLTLGDYYFVETKAPGEHAISGSALNDAENRLTFKITENTTTAEDLHIDFINFLKPTSKKEVTNGTAPKTNNSTFAIGDAVAYQNTIRVPKDIMGSSTLQPNGSLFESTPYTVFNYTDTAGTGLSYFGKDTDIKITTKDGTVLKLGTDYTYSAVAKGFSINFIVGGTVSPTVAAAKGENLTISYQMILNESAVIDGPIENSFDLAWNNTPGAKGVNDHIKGKVPVYTGGAKFVKEDASTKAKLQNAKFVIMNEKGQYFDGWADANTDGVKDAKWSNTQPTTGGGVFTSNASGAFEIAGLSYGKYSLKEIQAPDGYQLLTNTVDFEIKDKTYTTQLAVENSKRPTMPITGSTQLIITLVAGVALVSVAGVYYKKRQTA
ncbi:SpaA isopeptide-forming pilin-related protein [Enterococcus rivorum]|uniref:Collagen-binding protein n=1 Tax=Enterococcus rivorum TaxID=762845 RepID=A0A1E5L0M1_9ENTE|nr:SpaA isopeptide-forming pilin-related protein [Enterococcus rivorum]MBP2098481.1 fimbrial isopeptide formation D2 family protein/LPXTG-motif cell wall-anchored protein [Enterococcus rivorum]OEH83668.1 collagen-binding protein [Enterococcus rivorum]